VGVPFGIAASLAFPDRLVLVATGDGSFGFNAIELDTAVRHRAPAVFVVANNGAWQIEVHDQASTYGRVAGTRLQFADHAGMARAFGMERRAGERADDLPGAIDRAFARRPAFARRGGDARGPSPPTRSRDWRGCRSPAAGRLGRRERAWRQG